MTEAADLYLRYRYSLLRTAIALTASRDTAEDLVQDTFVSAMPRALRIASMEDPGAYLRRVLINKFLRSKRARRVRSVRLAAQSPTDGDPANFVTSSDNVLQMLAGLPPRTRAVLCLRYVEDLSDVDIAEIMGISQSTVRVTARNGLANLRVKQIADIESPTKG